MYISIFLLFIVLFLNARQRMAAEGHAAMRLSSPETAAAVCPGLPAS